MTIPTKMLHPRMLLGMLPLLTTPACAPCDTEAGSSRCRAVDAAADRATTDQTVDGFNAVRVEIENNETFEQVGDLWVRRSFTGGIRHTFEETDRDQWTVYLHDHDRQRSVWLDLHTSKVSFQDQGAPVAVLSPILSAYSTHKAVNGLNANRVEIYDGQGAFQNSGIAWHELDQHGDVIDTFTECGRFDLLVCICKTENDEPLMIEMNLLTKEAFYFADGYTFLSDIHDSSDIILTEPNPDKFGAIVGSTSDPRVAINNAAQDFLPHLRDESWMSSVFGADYDSAQADLLASTIEHGDLSWFPVIETFPAATSRASVKGVTIGNSATGQAARLDGAYKGGTVYWSDALVGSGADELAARMVAVQEVAHHFDSLLNPRGLHTGGEGVVAVSLLYGTGDDHASTLSEAQLASLRRYRDHVDIKVGGTTIYGAELGFREWAIGAVSVVAIAVTFGAATPEVAAVDATLLAGEVIAEETVVDGAALLTEESAAALESAGEAVEVVEGVAAPTAESLLGAEFTGDVRSVSGLQIETAHATLEEQGYRFVGYRGTNSATATSIVNDGIAAPSPLPGDPWDAFYVADDATVAAGYATGTAPGNYAGAQIVRVYLPTAEANALQNISLGLDDVAAAGSEAEAALGSDAWNSGNYLIRGRSGTENQTETILGWVTAKKAVVIPSSIKVGQTFAEFSPDQLIVEAASQWEFHIPTPIGLPAITP
ncbi:MAG: hypothetical protein K0V04_30165 [Deltaproteobacteria bacterium]|nr:hypothetical protein [Deltaproteobacteria bacterium]